MGVCLAGATGTGRTEIRVYFRMPDGEIRDVSPSGLPAHDTAFAMTIHQSQGSEFGRLLVMLPVAETEVLTRELLYTAVTRTTGAFDLWCPQNVFRRAVRRRTRRGSGLEQALRGE